jgi:hypothetical protein
MKKRSFLAAAAALLLGAAGLQPTQLAPVASHGSSNTVQPTDSTSRTPQAPAPVAQAQSVAVRASRAGGSIGAPVRFVERPGPRRVKYGRGSKWVLLA